MENTISLDFFFGGGGEENNLWFKNNTHSVLTACVASKQFLLLKNMNNTGLITLHTQLNHKTNLNLAKYAIFGQKTRWFGLEHSMKKILIRMVMKKLISP